MDMVVRVAIIYAILVIGLRVMGKREFSQLSPLELVTLLIIPEIVSQAIVREDYSITGAVIGVATLFSLTFLNSVLTHYMPPFEKVVAGSPTVLVSHGQFLPDNMNKERITPDEVYTEMHKVGLHDVAQIQWAVLESDGKISFIPIDQRPSLPPQEKQLTF